PQGIICPNDQQSVGHVAVSPTGQQALTVGWDNTIRLWDWGVKESQPSRLMLHHFSKGNGYVDVAFSPDGKLLLTANGKCRLWRVPIRSLLRQIASGRVEDLAFSPDGKLIAAAAGDSLEGKDPVGVQCFEVATGKPVGKPISHEGHGAH